MRDSILSEGDRFARGNRELLFDNINPRDKLSDRMFDLQPGIHLHEIIVPITIQEFHRAGIGII